MSQLASTLFDVVLEMFQRATRQSLTKRKFRVQYVTWKSV